MANFRTERVIAVEGIFNGIYGWGDGFYSQEKANRWDQFWFSEVKKLKPCLWRVFIDTSCSYDTVPYLVSTMGSVYMHPMNFSCVLRGIGGGAGVFDDELDELKELCDACAEFCGGSFAMNVSPEHDVPFGQMKPYGAE